MAKKPIKIYQAIMFAAFAVHVVLVMTVSDFNTLLFIGKATSIIAGFLLLCCISISIYSAYRNKWRWQGATFKQVVYTMAVILWFVVGFPLFSLALFRGSISTLLEDFLALPEYLLQWVTYPVLSPFIFFALSILIINIMNGLGLEKEVPVATTGGKA